MIDSQIYLTNDILPAPIQTPVLIAPADNANGLLSDKPNLQWSDLGDHVIAYLIESKFGWHSGDTIQWSGSWLVFVSPDQSDGNSITVKTPFGSGTQPHKWRIWAIGDSGILSISEWRILNLSWR